MSRKQSLLAVVLVFAALGYLFAYTLFTLPYFASDRETQSTQAPSAATEFSRAHADDMAREVALADEPASQAMNGALARPLSEDELETGQPSAVKTTVEQLSALDRLSGPLARSLMAEANFDELIRNLEKSDADAYLRQAHLLDNINRLDPVLDNYLRLRVLNCNDTFCGLSFDYDQDTGEEAFLQFMGALVATGTETGAMSVQPVYIDELPQLRVVIHRSASYEVE